jgi:hypothetical protein
MGVIFQKEVRVEPLTNAIASTIAPHMHAALAEASPQGMEATQQRARVLAEPAARAAAQAAAQPPTKMTISWKPFFISLGLFFLLLGIAIFLDWRDIVDDPQVYTGMVTTVLGVVIGFLGGDAVGTASSE